MVVTNYVMDNYVPGSYVTTGVPIAGEYVEDSVSAVASVGVAPMSTQVSSQRQVGEGAFFAGDYSLARRQFVRALLATPDDAEVLMLYGYSHFATGDYLVAALSVRRALEADPTLIEYPIDVCLLYGNQGDLAKHFSMLEEHLRKDDESNDVWFLHAYMRLAAGQAERAIGGFGKCMERVPRDMMAVLLRDAALRARTLQRASERAAVDLGPSGF